MFFRFAQIGNLNITWNYLLIGSSLNRRFGVLIIMGSNGLLKGIQEFSEHSSYFADFYRFYDKIISDGKVRSPQIILVTSASEGEGKTTISSYLSITAAMSSQKYHLLIDGDLHRPMVHKKFGIAKENGLTDVLTNNKELPQVIRKTPFRGLHVVTAGSTVANPFRLLSQEKTKNLFDRLRNYYSLVIVDAPPIVPVGDTLWLARYVDGIVLVIMAGKTPKDVAKRALGLIQEAKRPLLGTILNDATEVLPYYYQRKYYSYHYGTNVEAVSEKG